MAMRWTVIRTLAAGAFAGTGALWCGSFAIYAYTDGMGVYYVLLVGLLLYPLVSMITCAPRRSRPTSVAVRRQPLNHRISESAALLPQRRSNRGDQPQLTLMHPPLVPATYRRLDQQLTVVQRLYPAALKPAPATSPAGDGQCYAVMGGGRHELVIPAGHPQVPSARLSHGGDRPGPGRPLRRPR